MDDRKWIYEKKYSKLCKENEDYNCISIYKMQVQQKKLKLIGINESALIFLY